ncbi:hypothetical protein DK37_04810 [Halomonas sp. SUBG004]|nr:hypothetical protein DK37_04810 [Halomonas sp. SUBG004]
MDISDPKQCVFGFLRAQFNRGSPKHFDMDLFFLYWRDNQPLYGSWWVIWNCRVGRIFGSLIIDFLNDTEEFENGRKLTNNLLKKLAEKEIMQ